MKYKSVSKSQKQGMRNIKMVHSADHKTAPSTRQVWCKLGFSDLKHHSGQTVIAVVILNPDHLDQSGITGGGLQAGSITQERQALAVPGKV